MKKTQRNRCIPFLMGVSQVLLTGFIVYWLIGQFKGEREGLYKELHYEFLQAQDQAMDSSLHIMLQPLLNDSLGTRDSLPHAVWISKSEEHGTFTQSSTFEINTTPGHDAVLRGVKMIIQMSEDSLGNTGVNSFSSLPEIDSIVLLNLASSRLKSQDHSEFKILWYNDSTDFIHSESNKRLRYFSGVSHPPMVFEVINYEPFLIKEIIPQILFGLLLLILTGSAFIFTYKSLKKQILLNTLRNEFISNVSHELKTPVSTVKVALESLQSYDQKKDARKTEEYLKMASLEMDRLDLLIQKILSQSMLESNKVVIQKQNVDLSDLCTKVIYSQQSRLDEIKGEIKFHSDNSEAFLSVDELYIQGVLINLIDNAIKYGGNPPLIDIELKSVQDKLLVIVKDNGPGIPKEFQQKVFERFFRIPSGDRHNVKGYGLGLSFASEVMKQHEGEIELDNNPTGGSIFTMVFKNQDEA